ncbi:unnamed protein product [Closterium sp. Naga37s-1]|nr:unnamed protein product [Closterium sp. Naga37s-1]
MVGWEELAALVEEAAAADAAEAGVAGTGLAEAADAAELGAALPVETEAAAVAGEMETARVAKPTAGDRQGTEGAAGNAAAFGGDSASHAASFQAAVPRFVGRGPAVAREQAPAAAETAAAAVRDASPGEGGVAAGVESAETPAAAVGADTQGHDRRAGGTMERRSPSQGCAPAPSAAAWAATHTPTIQAPENPGGGNGGAQEAATMPWGAGRDTTAAAGTRRSAWLGAITWGPPRGGHTPWMPAGRGGNGAVDTAGAAGRAHRGVLRGVMRGERGGRNQAPRAKIPVRTGPWRERHARPERVIPQRNEDQEASDHSGADPELMAGEEEASEEIFLDDESTPRRNNPEPQAREAATGLPRNRVEQGDTATKETDVPSPADLAGDDAI